MKVDIRQQILIAVVILLHISCANSHYKYLYKICPRLVYMAHFNGNIHMVWYYMT